MAPLVTITSVPIGPGTLGLDVRLSRNQFFLFPTLRAGNYSSSVVQFFSWITSSSCRSSLDRPSTCFCNRRTSTVLLILISLTECRRTRALALSKKPRRTDSLPFRQSRRASRSDREVPSSSFVELLVRLMAEISSSRRV